MHRRHRVPARSPAPSWAASSPNPAASTAGSSAGELPGHPDLGQVTVRVLQRHAGLARARPARTTPPPAARRHHRRPAGHPAPPAAPPARPGTRGRGASRSARPAGHRTAPGRSRCQLVQLGLDPGAQPLDQALQVAELRRPHLAGDLLPERQHQRQPLAGPARSDRLHIGNAGAQQRDPRDAALTGPPELQMRDRQALRVVIRRLEPVPVPQDQHIQVTRVHIVQAAVPHGVTVGQVTVDRLMPRRPQPVQHRLPFPLQVGDRGRHIDPGHHPPPQAALTRDPTIARATRPATHWTGEHAEACLPDAAASRSAGSAATKACTVRRRSARRSAAR